MAEGKDTGDGKVSPFGNHKGATMAGPSTGSHDFIKDNSSDMSGGDKPRDFNATGNRPQSTTPEVVPNPQEIPAGGKILLANPGPVSAKVTGTAAGVAPPKPFKLK